MSFRLFFASITLLCAALSGAYAGNIQVLSAIYGRNCNVGGNPHGAHLGAACDGKQLCQYHIDSDPGQLGDPARGCAKDYHASYACTGDAQTKSIFVPAEADQHNVTLDCR
jgi:hypothetical protein